MESTHAYWKKNRFFFFELEYWSSLYVRHCLDVMHIEKNVCENVIGTILNIPGKSKDGLTARKDLENLASDLNWLLKQMKMVKI